MEIATCAAFGCIVEPSTATATAVQQPARLSRMQRRNSWTIARYQKPCTGGQLEFARTNISLMHPPNLLYHFPVPLSSRLFLPRGEIYARPRNARMYVSRWVQTGNLVDQRHASATRVLSHLNEPCKPTRGWHASASTKRLSKIIKRTLSPRPTDYANVSFDRDGKHGCNILALLRKREILFSKSYLAAERERTN